MKIAVLAGGLSPEREVSLTSGSLIANALLEEGHRVALVDVYLGIQENSSGASLEDLFRSDGRYHHAVSRDEPDLELLKRESGRGNVLIGEHVIDICLLADVVFLALHGASGENGQIQATLDVHGIRYTGSGYVGSLLAMDKDLSKKILMSAGVRTPIGITVDPNAIDIEKIERAVGYPAVVKPISCGSSVGISMVDDRESLLSALSLARTVSIAETVDDVFASDAMRDIVAREFGEGFSSSISSSQLGVTNLIQIKVTDASPEEAFKSIEIINNNYTKITDNVFDTAEIDCRFSADGGIDLREQRCGDIIKINAPHVRRGCEPGNVSNHATAHRNHAILSGKAVVEHRLEQGSKGLKTFGALARPDRTDHALLALCGDSLGIFLGNARIGDNKHPSV
jgi:D-alanine--D-alanine ligase